MIAYNIPHTRAMIWFDPYEWFLCIGLICRQDRRAQLRAVMLILGPFGFKWTFRS